MRKRTVNRVDQIALLAKIDHWVHLWYTLAHGTCGYVSSYEHNMRRRR